MRKSIILGLMSLALVLAVVACGGSEPTAVPTTAAAATLPAATNAPAPTTAPAATSAPAATTAPTAASTNPTAATSSSGNSEFEKALQNAKEAKVYRVDMALKASGVLLGGGAGAPGASPSTEPETLMTMSGSVVNEDSDMKVGGLLMGLMAGFLGFDPEKEVEFLKVGDNNYIKGTLSGKTESEWYILEGSDDATQTPVSPSRLLESLEEANLKPEDFTKSGTETLDGISCDVFTADKAAVVKAFGSIGTSDEPLDPETVDDANLKFYICSDGYLHQMMMQLTAHEKETPANKGVFDLTMHVFDINSDIKIEEPKDAKPLEMPNFGAEETPTVTPTP